MKQRCWQVRRTAGDPTDGDQQWDRVYQTILSWSGVSPADPTPSSDQDVNAQESDNAHGRVSSGVNRTSSAEPGA